MNTFFGDKRIALEPIPKDATAVVVRVETWEKMESALTTLRAERDQWKQRAEKAESEMTLLKELAGTVMADPGTQKEVDRVRTMESELVTLREEMLTWDLAVPKMRAMERVVEIVGRILPMTSWWVGPEVDELRAAYEQVVKS